MQDITELRQAEKELPRARQDMLDLAQKAARAVAFDWYIGARESENAGRPSSRRCMACEPGTFDRTYRGWKKLVHPDDWPSVKLAIERAGQSGDVDAEYRVVQKDGGVRWLQAKGRMFFDAERRPERMVGFMIDVTQRRQAEEELRAAETRFRTFVDHAMDAFFLHDEQLKLVDVNRQACQSLGYTREELVGMHPREFDVTLDEAAIARIAQRARAGEKVTFETRHRRKDGTCFRSRSAPASSARERSSSTSRLRATSASASSRRRPCAKRTMRCSRRAPSSPACRASRRWASSRPRSRTR